MEFVYTRLVYPQKNFHLLMEIAFLVNLTKNLTSIYQAQGAFCGEGIVKFYVKYKSIMDNLMYSLTRKEL